MLSVITKNIIAKEDKVMYKVNWVFEDQHYSCEFATLHAAFVAARGLKDGGIEKVWVPSPDDEDAFYMVPRHPEL